MPIWIFRVFSIGILDAGVLAVVQAVWKIALFLGCIGLFTRTSLTVSFLLGFYLLGIPHNYGKTHHYDAIVVLILGILALSRAGDVWSIDRWRQKDRRPIAPGGEYTWPIRAIWLVMSLAFCAAGLAKIRHGGLEWLMPQNMSAVLIYSQYGTANAEPLTSLGLALAQVPWLCTALAVFTVVFETAYPVAMFSTRARFFIVGAMLGMQIGIRLFLGPTFVNFMLCNIFWVPWDKAAALAARLGSEEHRASRGEREHQLVPIATRDRG